MNLVLDTSIYLGFYELSGDDLEELEKLVVAVRLGNTILYITEQIRNEFRRNRAGTISASLKLVESSRLPTAYPRLFTNLPGYASLREALREYESQRKALLDQVRNLARAATLKADGLIEELFSLGTSIPLTSDIEQAAMRRRALGNPPGKKDSIGDAVNWESLLATVSDEEDLVIVSADGDYASRLDEGAIDEFLAQEWRERKGSDVSLNASLTSLFRTYYPDIRLAADLERELAVDALIASPSFRATHLAIQKLSSFAEFSTAQVRALAAAARTNSQVERILVDSDVHEFYSNLQSRYPDQIDAADLLWLRERLENDPGSEWS